MNAFETWRQQQISGFDDSGFIVDYLNRSETQRSFLIKGEVDKIQTAFDVLNELDTETLISLLPAVECIEESSFSPADVPCFSTLQNGMVRLSELLEFYPTGMSFYEIGFQMKKQKNDMACIKYGENHAKLAAKMTLVTISHSKPAVVSSTAIGRLLIKYSLEEKRKVLKALLLSDRFIQFLVDRIVSGSSSYAEIVPFLKPTTAYRRKTSVKQLAEFVLLGTKFENCLNQFEWKV